MDAKVQSLYGISNDFLALNQALMDAEGDLSPELEEAMVINEAEFTQKAANYAALIRYFQAQEVGLKEEMSRLSAYCGSLSNKIDRLKENLKVAIEMRGGTPVEAGSFRLSLRSAVSVNILDESLIPKKFMVTKTTKAPDKKEIKAWIDSGKKVRGAELRTNKSVQIK